MKNKFGGNLLRYIDILKVQKKPFRFITSRILRYSGLWRLFTIKRNDFCLRLHPASLSMQLWVNPDDRDMDSYVLQKILRSGDTYVDAGANIGHLVIEASKIVGSTGKVFAFEAHPRTAKFLLENVSLNKLNNIYIMQAAVGEDFGWVRFSDKKSDDQNNIIEGNNGMNVPVCPLRSYIPRKGVRLLKIDTEGFELFVVKGLGDFILNIDFIYFEVMKSHFEKFNYTFSDLYNALDSYGFKIIQLKQNTKSVKIDKEHLFEKCTNLLACRNFSKLSKIFPLLKA